MLEDEGDGGFLAFGRVFVFAEEAFDEDAHLGASGVADLPIDGGAFAELFGEFGGEFFEGEIAHLAEDFGVFGEGVV